MMPSAEANFHRQGTKSFIAADQEIVIMVPTEELSDGEGGKVRTDKDPRAAQIARLLPQTARATERQSLDGTTVPVEFLLLMLHDAAVEVGDHFDCRGRSWQVIHVQEKRDYQTKCELEPYRG